MAQSSGRELEADGQDGVLSSSDDSREVAATTSEIRRGATNILCFVMVIISSSFMVTIGARITQLQLSDLGMWSSGEETAYAMTLIVGFGCLACVLLRTVGIYLKSEMQAVDAD